MTPISDYFKPVFCLCSKHDFHWLELCFNLITKLDEVAFVCFVNTSLREWVQRKSQLEREREEKKQERSKKRRELLEQGPSHQFQGSSFYEEKAQIHEELEDALEQGTRSLVQKYLLTATIKGI